MPRLIPFLMVLAVCSPPVAQAELPTKPEDVLTYLASVYKSGDIEAYSDLLTGDYKFVMGDDGGGWDKKADVTGTRALFGAATAKLSFPGECSVKPGPQPGTWIIEDVTCALEVTDKNKTWHVENTCSFLIRNENGKMRIAEWRQKEAE